MANTPQHNPQNPLNTTTAAARLEALASVGICPCCQQEITPLTAGTKALLAELIRLHEELGATRLESANRLAAIQAALGAAGDGEADPLDYLRWELPGESAETGRGRR